MDIDLGDPAVLRDPVTAYRRAPVLRLGPMWVLTRYEQARAMLGDPRFEINAGSFRPPEVPEHCRPYLRTMTERPGPEHARLRRLVTPAFSARRAEEFRPRIEPLVHRLLDAEPDDLVTGFARPLPIEVICELVGVPPEDRPTWREYGAPIASGSGQGFAAAIPGVVEGARAAINRPSPFIEELAGSLDETELVTMVWHLVLAGQTPANLIANAVAALLAHPDQLAELRDDPSLMPGAVEELIRWCGPQLLSIPRYAREEVGQIGKGEPVTAALCAANRDPEIFPDPDRLDIRRAAPAPHLGFAHGAHFCLGAALARIQT